MNGAFIFDLDGVLVDGERLWKIKKQKIFRELFGESAASRIGNTVGLGPEGVYGSVIEAGLTVDKDVLIDALHYHSDEIYKNAPIPEGVDELANTLKGLDFKIGIVSASPMEWIAAAMKRLSFKEDIETVISLNDHTYLRSKPAPDGYLEAMHLLNASPTKTVILEDSNPGIEAAKATGAYTIGLKENLIDGYVQQGADDYADTMKDVAILVEHRHVVMMSEDG